MIESRMVLICNDSARLMFRTADGRTLYPEGRCDPQAVLALRDTMVTRYDYRSITPRQRRHEARRGTRGRRGARRVLLGWTTEGYVREVSLRMSGDGYSFTVDIATRADLCFAHVMPADPNARVVEPWERLRDGNEALR